jgi:TDG/mug DNA glycosylase family protein
MSRVSCRSTCGSYGCRPERERPSIGPYRHGLAVGGAKTMWRARCSLGGGGLSVVRSADCHMGVPDVAADGLRVLFVGINPDPISARVGHHFANPVNRFWRLLHESGFTRRRIQPEEERELLSLGIGVTNLVPRTTHSASELSRADFERGRRALMHKLARWQPRAVIFVGVTAWRAFQDGGRVDFGEQPYSLLASHVFVLPHPSGRNARLAYAEMLRLWIAVSSELKLDTRPQPHP